MAVLSSIRKAFLKDKNIISLLKRHHLVLVGILAVALGLRLWGISFGLPYRYHPDEPQHVVEAAQMLAERRLEPAIFNNPPFYKYVLAISQAGFFGGALLFGGYDSSADLVNYLKADPSSLYLVSRIASALAGSATVWVTYLLGKFAYNRRVGLLAAAFLAVTFLHVRDSHYAVNDALLGLLTAVSLLGSLRVAQRGRAWDYGLAAVAAGLAFATKYTAIFTVIPLIIAHFLSPGVQFTNLAQFKLKRLVSAGILVALSAAIGSPYFLLKPGKVLSDISRSIYSFGQYGFEGWQMDPVGGYIFYIKSLWWGLGPALFMLAILGLGLALIRHSKEDILLVSYPLLLYLFMGRQQMYFARFIIPAIPPVLVLAASVAESFASYIAAKINLPITINLKRSVVMGLIFFIAAAQPAFASIRHNYLLTYKDTRTLAKEWIEANISENSKVAVDWPHHGPPLSTRIDPEPISNRTYEVIIAGGNGLADNPIEFYRKENVQYIIVSSNIYNVPLADIELNHKRQTFYASLDKNLTLINEIRYFEGDNEPSFVFDELYGPAISIWQRERPGPAIRIYELQ